MSETRFKPYLLDQDFLLPPSLKEWLPTDHLAYFIIDVVQVLDLGKIYEAYKDREVGQPPYDPRMMVALLLYAYCVGVYSSRKIEKATYEWVPFRIVAGDQHPDHDTIAEFRKRHLDALSDLFVQVLKLCQEAKLVKLGHVALDGTKLRAQASKHKAMSYERILKKEKQLKQEVDELLKRAQSRDNKEDEEYGQGVRGDELPEELKFKQGRLNRLREAKKALNKRAKDKAKEEEEKKRKKQQQKAEEREQSSKDKEGSGSEGTGVNESEGKSRKKKKAKPKKSDQYNFTDPDSRIMVDKSVDAFVQAYNCQAAVDDESQVIVAADVTQESNDKRQLQPMVERISENCGGKQPEKLTADEGYFSSQQIEAVQEKTDLYVAIESQKRMKERKKVARGPLPKGATTKERMARKVNTKAGRKIFGLRKQVVEPVFGQIKEVRAFRQFLLRGIETVKGEWNMVCTTHNLLKLYRANWNPTM